MMIGLTGDKIIVGDLRTKNKTFKMLFFMIKKKKIPIKPRSLFPWFCSFECDRLSARLTD